MRYNISTTIYNFRKRSFFSHVKFKVYLKTKKCILFQKVGRNTLNIDV